MLRAAHGVWYLQGSATAGSQTKAGPSQAGRTRSVVVEGGDVVVMVVVVVDVVVVVVVVVNVVVVRVVVVEVVVDVLVGLVMVLLVALVVSVAEVVPLDAAVADVGAPVFANVLVEESACLLTDDVAGKVVLPLLLSRLVETTGWACLAVVSASSPEVPEVVETEAVLVLTTVV